MKILNNSSLLDLFKKIFKFIKFITYLLILNINLCQAQIIKNINIETQNCLFDNIKQDNNFKYFIKQYKTNKNQKFSQDLYENFKIDLLDLVKNHGYLDAEYTIHKVNIYKKNNTAAINLSLDCRSRYYLNNIRIIKNSSYNLSNDFIISFISNYKKFTSDYNIEKYENFDQIKLKNTPYNTQDILDFQNNITKYIKNLDIETNIDNINKKVNIEIKILPFKKYLYNIGIGYDTNEGARLFGDSQTRNITEYGHQLDLGAKVAQYQKLFNINYIIPGYYPASDSVQFGYQYRFDNKRNNYNLEKERNQITSQYQRTLNNNKLQYTGGISYRAERFRDIKNNKSRQSWLLVPYFTYDQLFTKDLSASINNKLIMDQGHRIYLLVEAANDNILSTTSFVKLHAKFKSILPIEYQYTGLRLLLKAQYGEIWHDEQAKIPPTMRFFAGGLDSIRGYGFESLGPRTINTKGKSIITGGDKLAIFSAELEKYLYKDWALAVFYDVGNALDSWKNIEHNLYAGAGVGIRWHTPLGPLRLNLSNALDKKSKPWRIEFNIGPDL